ncbi:hypothetical protein GGI26_001936 [Coemansia sp. RSA 1358]|uniref:Mid2 domain-containing protein n=1 Tax=Coemansia umbellata TaxID=1424467 RepID=A0ABQ8PHX3_9FUNG|nr:hypothetical protein EDC05_004756 [Coemansia umbellata]KAJ2623921.1 hypothetical protein GGI26_001936 [Coemansia sp. RSA 1358]
MQINNILFVLIIAALQSVGALPAEEAGESAPSLGDAGRKSFPKLALRQQQGSTGGAAISPTTAAIIGGAVGGVLLLLILGWCIHHKCVKKSTKDFYQDGYHY